MKILDIQQGSAEWFEARAGIPTVSEFFRFITAARGDYSKQAVGYMADLIVETVQGPAEGMTSYYMDRGTALEAEARSDYELIQDVDVEVPGLILNKGAGWSPDGCVGAGWQTGLHSCGALEIKCPKPSTHVKWLLEDKLPDEHKPQIHGALLIGELDWIDFISYCPGFKTLCIRAIPDDYTKKVEAALQAFLKEYDDAKRRILTVARSADADE